MIPIPAQEPRKQLIRVEGIRTQLDNLPQSCLTTIVMGLVVVATAYENTGWPFALGWLSCTVALSIGRWVLWRRYKAAGQAANIERLGLYATVASCISGLTWGVGALIAYFQAPWYMHTLTVPMLIMLGAVAIFAATSYLPAFYVFFYTAAFPPILTFFHADRYLLGAGFLLYAALVTRMVKVNHQRYKDGVNMRLDNLALVQALSEQKAQAEKANSAKSRFLAAASHDLRQPMHALSLFIESLSSSKLPPYEMNLIANMRQSSAAMETQFDALLDVSQLDAGSVEPSARPLALAPLLQRLHAEFEPLASERNLPLRLRLPTAPAWVHTDEALLSRVVSNILTNAVRYGVRSGGVGILLALRPKQNGWSIEVWDTGPGIAPADQERVFSEFYQVGNPERDRSKGLGLGLAIVDRLVKLLKLRLHMQSRLGHGTGFRVWIPKASAPNAPLVSQQIKADPDLSGLFVLVIDDEQAIRQAMALLLAQWGCATLQAGSGAEMKAQLAFERRIPDLIICDYRLRGEENGVAVIDELRSEYNRDIPGLIVTGDFMSERLQQAAERGLKIAYKPLNPTRLRTLVQESCQRNQGATAP